MTEWIEVNGVSLRYRWDRAGDKAVRLPLVLIHELGGSIESWDGIMAWLAPAGDVLRYDCRGAGMSEKITAVTLEDLVDDLAALLNALPLHGRVAIGGGALGCAIAVRFAVRHPARVAALALMAPTTSVAPTAAPTMRARADAFAKGLRAATPPEVLERIIGDVTPPEQLGDPRILQKLRARYWHPDPESHAAYYRLLATPLDVGADLAQLACPTLVLAGRYDKVRPPERLREVARAIPGSEFDIVESGHMMALQNPERTGPVIAAFLNARAHPASATGDDDAR